jgi:hypothetical protein
MSCRRTGKLVSWGYTTDLLPHRLVLCHDSRNDSDQRVCHRADTLILIAGKHSLIKVAAPMECYGDNVWT